MLKDRKKPTEHRQGKLVKLLDLVQRFSEMHHDEDYWLFDENDGFAEGYINPKHQNELDDMMRELRVFDITEIGDLYLTSGGRVVLDKGYGEYFREGDTVIYTREQLTSGILYEVFKNRISEISKEPCENSLKRCRTCKLYGYNCKYDMNNCKHYEKLTEEDYRFRMREFEEIKKDLDNGKYD